MHDQEANNQLNLSVLASVWDSRCPGSPRNKDNKAMGKEIESDMAIFKLSSTAHRSDLLGHCYTKSEQLPSKNPIHWQMVQPPQGERIVLLRKVAQNRGRLVAFCSTRWPKKNSLLQAEEFFRHFFSPCFLLWAPNSKLAQTPAAFISSVPWKYHGVAKGLLQFSHARLLYTQSSSLLYARRWDQSSSLSKRPM